MILPVQYKTKPNSTVLYYTYIQERQDETVMEVSPRHAQSHMLWPSLCLLIISSFLSSIVVQWSYFLRGSLDYGDDEGRLGAMIQFEEMRCKIFQSTIEEHHTTHARSRKKTDKNCISYMTCHTRKWCCSKSHTKFEWCFVVLYKSLNHKPFIEWNLSYIFHS